MIEAFVKYLQFEKRLSLHTVEAYKSDLTQFQSFLKSEFNEPKTELASYQLVRAWIATLSDQGRDARSVNRKIAALRTFYKYLMRQELIDKDPTIKIKALKTTKKLPSFVKQSEIIDVLEGGAGVIDDGFENLRNRLILELLYATGIRLSELINLKDTDIDSRKHTIKVLGKRNKERIIPFHRNLLPIIQHYQRTRNREIATKEHGFLLVTEKGDKCYPGLVYKVVNKQLRTKSTVDKKSPHVLRHTFATHLLDQGAEINAVKDLLGHANLAATQVYTHNSMEKIKKTFDQAHPKA